MRISDLSRQTGVPIATTRLFRRERLLPPGTPTGRRMAPEHHATLRFGAIAHVSRALLRTAPADAPGRPGRGDGTVATTTHLDECELS
ncbi:MerR family transcriptional regulator [Micromonospora sp. DT178]|uniref:MerR family transcriptional regulator n=1 Tax=Micromonospora sp. DT178 TaxID=3393436 RepID=UPI003CEF785F